MTERRRRTARTPKGAADALFAELVETIVPESRDDRAVLHRVRKIVDLEELIVILRADIDERGPTEVVVNGGQTFTRANVSVASLLKCIAEQRRLLATLPLVKPTPSEEEELDDFDRF